MFTSNTQVYAPQTLQAPNANKFLMQTDEENNVSLFSDYKHATTWSSSRKSVTQGSADVPKWHVRQRRNNFCVWILKRAENSHISLVLQMWPPVWDEKGLRQKACGNTQSY